MKKNMGTMTNLFEHFFAIGGVLYLTHTITGGLSLLFSDFCFDICPDVLHFILPYLLDVWN